MKSNAQAAPSKTTDQAKNARANGKTHAKAEAAPAGRRIQVRKSGIHGKGVFALRPFEPGETIIEYKGEIISWKEALRRHPHDPSDPNHTFFFHIDDEHVIDGKVNGNAARWINHACDPNCEADEVEGRVFVKAIKPVAPGEELFYDYGLIIDERYTPKLKKQFACHCGADACRGTMLAKKR
ncbi:SET domain-containing protein [Ideonella sp. BN130291]|uniref:SET domain-containing protein n=1 Tax=Ideonella sp. BN130291 TaxID=3112940 RepID=UPI002E255869|nr:SET domain-containing protein-lysine N-methyltransferase [Ideonella sp. BN130291]